MRRFYVKAATKLLRHMEFRGKVLSLFLSQPRMQLWQEQGIDVNAHVLVDVTTKFDGAHKGVSLSHPVRRKKISGNIPPDLWEGAHTGVSKTTHSTPQKCGALRAKAW